MVQCITFLTLSCLLIYSFIYGTLGFHGKQTNKFRFYTLRAIKHEEQNNFKLDP